MNDLMELDAAVAADEAEDEAAVVAAAAVEATNKQVLHPP
jgi:hypothetical protein